LYFEAALVEPPACAGIREPADKSAIAAAAAEIFLNIAISSIRLHALKVEYDPQF